MKRLTAAGMALLLCLLLFAGTQTANAQGGVDASAFFHVQIVTNKDVYESGETGQVSLKYTIDTGKIQPGDYVLVTIPQEIASGARFTVSPQHFSKIEDLGGGVYRLVFGDDAPTAVSGSSTARITFSAQDTTEGTIRVGETEKKITVTGSGSSQSGVGTYADEAIMKDGLGNDDMSWGGWDYSDDVAAQIGIFDSSEDHEFVYRLFINRKNVEMSDVTVTDTLPDGMEFAPGMQVVCHLIDPDTMRTTDTVFEPEDVTVSGRTLTVRMGDLTGPVQITYTVFVPAQTSVQLRNHAEIVYTQDGETYKEHRDYIAQSDSFAASNGVKSVDKTTVSADPDDQWVTYSIRFWNDGGFEAGEISLTDVLDEHVRFLYADADEYFTVTQDPDDPRKILIRNEQAIPSSTEVFVTFVCDFTDVPEGYTVENTVGGNTTKTQKVSGSVELTVKKTLDGDVPEEAFRFLLYDEEGKLLQETENDASGEAVFEKLTYSEEDLGMTFRYRIEESKEDPAEGILYDDAVYDVTVTVAEKANENGQIPVTVRILKDGEETQEILFENRKTEPERIRISGEKTWEDAQDKDGLRPASITVHLYADEELIDTKTVTAQDDWKWDFGERDKEQDGKEITYRIDEEPVEGYTAQVNDFDITNTHTPQETPEKPQTPEKPEEPVPKTGDAFWKILIPGLIVLISGITVLMILLIRRKEQR